MTEGGTTKTYTVPAKSLAADDVHFTAKYDSLRAKLLVVDVLLADYAQIDTLVSMDARIGTIEADYINTTNLYSSIANLASVSVQSLTSERGGISVYSVSTTTYTQGSVVCYVPNAVTGINLVDNEDGTYTIQRQRFNDSGWVNVGTFEKGDVDAAYNQGWNDCIDEASKNGHSCLTGYSNYNSASSTSLYYYDTSSLSYKVATGSAKVWRYGGGTNTYYSLPAKKT